MGSKIKQFKYTSSLSGFIQEHVAEKRALGVLFNTDAKILQNFDRYVLSWDGGTATTITQELAASYSKRRPNEGVAYQLLRIKTVNKLSSYMIRNGIDAYMIPSEKMPRKKESFTPYIFTDEQIERIFKAADTISKSTSNRHQGIVAPVFFRMLYSTGMRISEISTLCFCDIDTNTNVIRIRHAKFNKQRLIPMSQSLAKICHNYIEKMMPVAADMDAPFFPNGRNTFYEETAIYNLFRKIIWKAGISHGGKNAGPRLHDFRHTFAVHCLRNWSVQNADLTAALPYLSAYMGHTGLQQTQKYLRLTADIYPELVERLSQEFGYIIPSVENRSTI